MEFAEYTVTLLKRNPEGPQLGEADAAAMQDRHMAHIADLAGRGHLVAAGPILDEIYRGLSILTVPPEDALALQASDPAVRAGLYSLVTLSWRLPAGAMTFTPIRFPRSMADVLG